MVISMDIINGDNRIEIDMASVICGIDRVIHDEITDKSGLVVSHEKIIKFVTDIIIEHNHAELRLWYELERENEMLEKREKEIDSMIRRGKIVNGVNSFTDKVKYHILGYIDVGEGK